MVYRSLIIDPDDYKPLMTEMQVFYPKGERMVDIQAWKDMVYIFKVLLEIRDEVLDEGLEFTNEEFLDFVKENIYQDLMSYLEAYKDTINQLTEGLVFDGDLDDAEIEEIEKEVNDYVFTVGKRNTGQSKINTIIEESE